MLNKGNRTTGITDVIANGSASVTQNVAISKTTYRHLNSYKLNRKTIFTVQKAFNLCELTARLSLLKNTGNKMNGVSTINIDRQYIPKNALSRNFIIFISPFGYNVKFCVIPQQINSSKLLVTEDNCAAPERSTHTRKRQKFYGLCIRSMTHKHLLFQTDNLIYITAFGPLYILQGIQKCIQSNSGRWKYYPFFSVFEPGIRSGLGLE